MAFGRLGAAGTGFGRLGSSGGAGGGVAAPAAGGGALLVGETDGFATDFLYATDAQRVAVKTAGTVVASTVDAFYTQAGTSPKMVYDASGVLGWSPHNLVKQSSALDDGAWWIPTNVTVVANQAVAPDGTTTMDKIYPTSSGGNRWITPTMVGSAVTHTFSVFAKAAGLRWIYFLSFDGVSFAAWFDLQNGVVGNVIAGYTSAIQAIGNGVYRCSLTGMGEVAFNAYIGVSDANGGSTVTASGTDGVYLWGAQVNRGTVPTAYLPTTTAARYGLAIDYDPVTHAAKGLLVEPQATNAVVPSTPSSPAWTLRGAVTLTAGQSDPTGGATAALVAGIGSNSVDDFYHGSIGVSVSAGGRYELSVFIKRVSTSGTLCIGEAAVGPANGLWDINLALLGSGWERITRSHAAVTIINEFVSATGFSTGLQFYRQAGASPLSFHIWCVQIDSGSVATSPIPTTSATVTRAGDNIGFLLSTIPVLGSQWSMYARFAVPVIDSAAYVINLNDGTTAEFTGIRVNGNPNLIIKDGGVELVNEYAANSALVANIPQSAACRVKLNDCAIGAAGLTPFVDTSATLPTLTQAVFGSYGVAVAGAVFRVEKLVIVPRAWSDAELQTRSAT